MDRAMQIRNIGFDSGIRDLSIGYLRYFHRLLRPLVPVQDRIGIPQVQQALLPFLVRDKPDAVELTMAKPRNGLPNAKTNS